MSPGIDRRTIGDWNGAGAAAMGTSHVLTHGGGTFPLVGLSFVGLISTTPVFVGGDNFQFAAPNISYVMSTPYNRSWPPQCLNRRVGYCWGWRCWGWGRGALGSGRHLRDSLRDDI